MRELKLTRIRKNPFKFTGPKTTRGKAASSRNAMKHGVLSIAPVVPGLETLEDWNDHRAGIVTSLVPTGYVESLLAERIALIAWRLRRVVRYEVEATVASAATAEIDMEDEERFGVGKPGYRGRHPEQVQAHFLILVELLKELPEMPADKKIDSARARDILFVFARGLPKDIDRGAISIPGIPSDAGGLDRFDLWTAGLLQKAIEVYATVAQTTPDTIMLMARECVGEQFLKACSDVQSLAERKAKWKLRLEREIRRRILLQPDVLGKVTRYENSLERSFFRNLHELQRLQAARSGVAVTPPGALDLDVTVHREDGS